MLDFDYHLYMPILTWIISGGVGNVIAVKLFFNIIKNYKIRFEELVKEGRSIGSFFSYDPTANCISPEAWSSYFFVGNIIAFCGSI